jgi:hypothetical protein
MDNLPLGLRTALESGTCVLFVGAGIGVHLKDANGRNAPTARDLAREIAANFSIDPDTDVTDLSKIASYLEAIGQRKELDSFIHERLSNLSPDEAIQWLTTIRWRSIYTTNYDDSLLKAYTIAPNLHQEPISISVSAEFVKCDPRFQVPIYFLHGTIFGANRQILISKSDYTAFREKRRMLFECLKQDFATSPILYVGYSNQDPNWEIVLDETMSEFGGRFKMNSYRIAPALLQRWAR